MELLDIQKLIPARVKFALKPYYRTIFPNRLHVYWYPTFRCNYRCSYCPVVTKFSFASVVGKAGERSAADWIEAFDRLPPFVLYIAGGEPFVYAELAEVVNSLPSKHSVMGIVTNLSQPASVYRKINKRIHLNASFHREFTSDDAFIGKIRELKDHFDIHVNIVATVENLPLLEKISGEFSDSKIPLHVDPYIDLGFHYSDKQLEFLRRFLTPDRHAEAVLDFEDFGPKKCSAGRNYIHVSPDGSAYTCGSGLSFVHSTLYADWTRGKDLSSYSIGNIFDPKFKINSKDIICSLPCNLACDHDLAIIRPLDS
jgi:MoaA/NifB/PqqE/SkfB family radical SAM enzyme